MTICTEPVWAEKVTTDIYPGGEHGHAPPGTLNPCAWLENPSTALLDHGSLRRGRDTRRADTHGGCQARFTGNLGTSASHGILGQKTQSGESIEACSLSFLLPVWSGIGGGPECSQGGRPWRLHSLTSSTPLLCEKSRQC